MTATTASTPRKPTLPAWKVILKVIIYRKDLWLGNLLMMLFTMLFYQITGLAPGVYYLISTANFDHVFLEKDYTNNRAWVAFQLTRDSKGNARITIVGDSVEVSGEGVRAPYTTNR